MPTGPAMRLGARLYIAAVLTAGCALFVRAMAGWTCRDPLHYVCTLGIAMIASALKVLLPGINGNMSVSYFFVLLSIMDFSLPETVVLGCLSMVVQTLWRPRHRAKVLHLLFNLASSSIAVSGGYAAYRMVLSRGNALLSITVAATTYYALSSIVVALVVTLTESKSLRYVWREYYLWTFPYYMVGGLIAGAISACTRRFGWETSITAWPVVYVVFRSYRLYLGRLESEKRHAQDMAALHLRTIEALALAIEAKDDTTRDHLQRVQIYADELGKKMGLEQSQIQALRAASILHDIGKLAVPEHIISKPGRLTSEEFDKMKIHPIVGAEILDRVKFPYAVVPIVRHHHEKWDGSGYPDGLQGEQIPIGARILAAVDCLDALASDRQYRRALPLDEAMAVIVAEAGKSYDPRVVEILQAHYRDWEGLTRLHGPQSTRLSKGVAVPNGVPGAGYAARPAEPLQPEFLSSIAAARQEAQTLYELTQDLGNSLNLHETLSVLDSRLQRLIPYDSIAVYVRRENRLMPQYVNGENSRLFASLEIPVGQGLSGWVAETGQPIVNGNPSVEPGYLNDATKFSTLRSALAVPLENAVGITGVITLYHLNRDAFTKDHVRVLLALKSKLSLTIENALQYQQAAISATTDGLTRLPNARSLFLHLDAELARVKSAGAEVAVLVCDLDGFKQMNDRFGHLLGNRVLQRVAAGLRDCCRERDYVARMGGDEFVLVLPDFDARALPDRLRAIEEVAVEAGKEASGESLLNISVGAALFPRDGTDAESLLAEADRRMYLAKQEHKRLALAGAASLRDDGLAVLAHRLSEEKLSPSSQK